MNMSDILTGCIMTALAHCISKPVEIEGFNRVRFEAIGTYSGMLWTMVYLMCCLLHTGTGRRCVDYVTIVFALRFGGDSLPLSLQMA